MDETRESKIATLIDAAGRGDASASESLFVELYSELHRMAKRELQWRGADSLGATTLLHEAYLDMSSRGNSGFPDRARFMGYAARVMRGLIIDHVRNRQAQKRGGNFEITSVRTDIADRSVDAKQLTQIGDALDQLAKAEPELSEIVDLKFFCGFTFAEIGEMRNVTERTIQRRWEKARIYLYQSIRAEL